MVNKRLTRRNRCQIAGSEGGARLSKHGHIAIGVECPAAIINKADAGGPLGRRTGPRKPKFFTDALIVDLPPSSFRRSPVPPGRGTCAKEPIRESSCDPSSPLIWTWAILEFERSSGSPASLTAQNLLPWSLTPACHVRSQA